MKLILHYQEHMIHVQVYVDNSKGIQCATFSFYANLFGTVSLERGMDTPSGVGLPLFPAASDTVSLTMSPSMDTSVSIDTYSVIWDLKLSDTLHPPHPPLKAFSFDMETL